MVKSKNGEVKIVGTNAEIMGDVAILLRGVKNALIRCNGKEIGENLYDTMIDAATLTEEEIDEKSRKAMKDLADLLNEIAENKEEKEDE